MNEENLVPKGRLNGIFPQVGTVIAMDAREMQFTAVHSVDDRGCIVRNATPEEMTEMQYGEPRSVVEHRAIPRELTPFGAVRQIRVLLGSSNLIISDVSA